MKILTRFDPGPNPDPREFEFQLFIFSKLGNPPSGGPEPSEALGAAAGYLKIESALGGALDRYHELHADFLRQNEDMRKEALKEIETLRSDLEARRSANELEFEQKESRFKAEIEERNQELAVARKDLDDRSNTHVRRAIRSEIKDGINKSLTENVFSGGTLKQRIPIRIFYYVIILFLMAFAVYSTIELDGAINGNTSTLGWLLGVKASIGVLSTVALSLLYLRLEVRWNLEQANFEKMLASTRVDIDRASWVMESMLEWNRDAEKEMPESLVTALTRRLFDWDVQVESSHSNADSLASAILGAAANVKLGPNGAEVDLDNKGIRKLSA